MPCSMSSFILWLRLMRTAGYNRRLQVAAQRLTILENSLAASPL
jgi:hypothetical protein